MARTLKNQKEESCSDESLYLANLLISIGEELGYSSFHFGNTTSDNDIDIAIIQNSLCTSDIVVSTTKFTKYIYKYIPKKSKLIFQLFDHRHFVKYNRIGVHLLFYPSPYHIAMWEVPALSKLFLNGSIDTKNQPICFDLEKMNCFKANAQGYFRYIDIATKALIYYAIDSPFFPLEKIHNDLKYSSRYFCEEIDHSQSKIREKEKILNFHKAFVNGESSFQLYADALESMNLFALLRS